MIYESKPFIVEAGAEIEIAPIEFDKNSKEKDKITSGILLKDGSPAKNFMLKIYKVTKNGRQIFLGFTATDSFGQFTIPLSSKGNEYLIKAYSLKEETEDLELIIK